MNNYLSTLLVCGAAILSYMALWFIVSVIKNRNDVADIGYGLGFVLIAWTALIYNDASNWPAWLVAILVSVWGLRLFKHIASRLRGKPEDYRYVEMRQKWPEHKRLRAFVFIFMLQGLLILVISAPVVAVMSNASTMNLPVIAGTLLWLVGFYWESTGDRQLKAFIKNPANKGQLMRNGLWARSRHPNYFGEIAEWTGLYVIALSTPFGWVAFYGPLALYLFIRYVSGVPLLEERMAKKPGWAIYKKNTPMLFPRLKF